MGYLTLSRSVQLVAEILNLAYRLPNQGSSDIPPWREMHLLAVLLGEHTSKFGCILNNMGRKISYHSFQRQLDFSNTRFIVKVGWRLSKLGMIMTEAMSLVLVELKSGSQVPKSEWESDPTPSD